MHRFLIRILCAATMLLVAAPALAQFTRDKAAQKKLEEAINQHYFGTDFDKAEGVLTGTIKACEDKCSPQTLAKAWMYVGIVRGSGKQDMNGAREAFMNAIALDPQATLDEAIASPETKTVWAEITGTAAAPPTPPPVTDGGTGGTPIKGRKVAGNMECTLEATEIQKRYPVEFACTTEEEAAEAELRYKPFGSEKWEKKKMRKKGDYFVAQIPCDATMDVGDLKIYIRASGEEGIVDQWGKKSEPVVLKVVNKTDQEVPSLPDKDPPDRCAEKVECPPDFPGCGKGAAAKRGDKPWGSACEADVECQQGLACVNGSCEEGQSCEVDEDCSAGTCVGGTCAGGAGGGGGDTGPKGPYKKIWVGLHVAQDLAIVGGDDVCSQRSQAEEGFACFFTDETGTLVQYGFDPQPGFANKINTGLAPGTTRFLLSGDYALTDKIMVGARLGYAIGGGPATVDAANNEIKFLPIHAEARGSFWFNRVPGKGLHPYVHVGAGMAQVDAKLPVTIRDCSRLGGVDIPPDSPQYSNCATGEGGAIQPHDPLELDAYKKLGQGFGGLGGGAVYGLTDTLGIQLNLNIMFMMPTSGIVIQPSLGGVYGF